MIPTFKLQAVLHIPVQRVTCTAIESPAPTCTYSGTRQNKQLCAPERTSVVVHRTGSPNGLPANAAMWYRGCIFHAAAAVAWLSVGAPLVQRLKATRANALMKQLLSTTHLMGELWQTKGCGEERRGRKQFEERALRHFFSQLRCPRCRRICCRIARCCVPSLLTHQEGARRRHAVGFGGF